jgi:hypothetical protein
MFIVENIDEQKENILPNKEKVLKPNEYFSEFIL